MGAVTRLEEMSSCRAKIGTETYRYGIPLRMQDWTAEMEMLAFVKLPDEIVDIDFPFTPEELQKKSHLDDS